MELHMIRFYVAAQKCVYGFVGLILLGLPVNLQAECQVTLKWTTNGASPNGYRLYERKAGQEYNLNHYYDVGPETACTVYELEENTTHHFVVRAYNEVDESDNSNEATYVCTKASSSSDANPPSMPNLISPEDTSQTVGLEPVLTSSEFYDPDPDDTHVQTRWQIFRSDNDECIYDVVSNSELTTIQVPSSLLEPLTAYYWTVSYYSQSGGKSEPAPASDFTTTDAVDSTASLSSGGGGGGGGSSDGFFGVGCFIQTLLGR
jgi:hypothetical protein